MTKTDSLPGSRSLSLCVIVNTFNSSMTEHIDTAVPMYSTHRWECHWIRSVGGKWQSKKTSITRENTNSKCKQSSDSKWITIKNIKSAKLLATRTSHNVWHVCVCLCVCAVHNANSCAIRVYRILTTMIIDTVNEATAKSLPNEFHITQCDPVYFR